MKKTIIPPLVSLLKLKEIDIIATSEQIQVQNTSDYDDSSKSDSRSSIWDD